MVGNSYKIGLTNKTPQDKTMKKITFVISEVKLHEHLSIMALSAALKNAGHDTSLVFLQNDPLNRSKIIDGL